MVQYVVLEDCDSSRLLCAYAKRMIEIKHLWSISPVGKVSISHTNTFSRQYSIYFVFLHFSKCAHLCIVFTGHMRQQIAQPKSCILLLYWESRNPRSKRVVLIFWWWFTSDNFTPELSVVSYNVNVMGTEGVVLQLRSWSVGGGIIVSKHIWRFLEICGILIRHFTVPALRLVTSGTTGSSSSSTAETGIIRNPYGFL